MEKTCFRCSRRLSVECFYRHPMMGDGRLGKCKECAKQDVRANYEATRDQKLAYERLRGARPERKASLRKATLSRQRARPDKHKAQLQAKAAIACGFLRPLPCVVCGEAKTDGHHEDYAKPLDLTWLCRKHHTRRHAELKALGIEL